MGEDQKDRFVRNFTISTGLFDQPPPLSMYVDERGFSNVDSVFRQGDQENGKRRQQD
ncbi:hypothetical protein J23TS9_49030 [Paenibacillus sp. J23TS9]|nr:hypothetical protein J23TS9_49030 [Paenibacillus sp. J23TS9]